MISYIKQKQNSQMAGDPNMLTLTFNGFAVPLTHVVCGMLIYTHLPVERNGKSFIGKELLYPKCHNTKRYCPPESHYFPLSSNILRYGSTKEGGGATACLIHSGHALGPAQIPTTTAPQQPRSLSHVSNFMNILFPKYIMMYIDTL